MQESLGWKNIVKEWEIPEIKTIYEMPSVIQTKKEMFLCSNKWWGLLNLKIRMLRVCSPKLDVY